MNKNWRNSWPVYFLIMIMILTLLSCGQKTDHAEHGDTYTCPMHPAVTSDRPGTCPVCGMDLVRKARTGEEIAITEDLSRLIKSPNETVVASIATIRGEYRSNPVTVEAQGVVAYDTRSIYTIAARVGGRLEKVYLKYVFQAVTKGQRIAALYSPELVMAQRELVFLLENDPENSAIINSASRKLELMGMTVKQIDNLIQNKEVHQTVSIYSPHTGYLIGAQEASSGSGNKSGTEASGALIKEGDYVSPGQTLFTVVDANALRIELNLPGSYAGMLRKGSKVEFDSGNRTGSVGLIQPFFTEGQEFLKIRVYLTGAEQFPIGQLVDAVIHLESKEALWVPRESVLDLGTRKVVFAKERGVLKPMEVTTGSRAGEMVEISAGLSSIDEIAANAQYLVDSESFIKPGK